METTGNCAGRWTFRFWKVKLWTAQHCIYGLVQSGSWSLFILVAYYQYTTSVAVSMYEVVRNDFDFNFHHLPLLTMRQNGCGRAPIALRWRFLQRMRFDLLYIHNEKFLHSNTFCRVLWDCKFMGYPMPSWSWDSELQRLLSKMEEIPTCEAECCYLCPWM